MGFFQYEEKKAEKPEKDGVKVFGNLPKFNDSLGQTYTSAKNPSFQGDPTDSQNPFIPSEPVAKWTAIDRWSIREETRKRFKDRYGALAEQKIKETAEKLRRESLYDAMDAPVGMTPNAGNASDDGTRPDINSEFEKMSLLRRNRKTLNKKKQS